MYKPVFILLTVILLSACGQQQPTKQVIDLSIYPEALQKILAHHGGLDTWQKMKALSYEIVKEKGNEKQMVDLKDRRERIEADNFTSGFDGKDIWVRADTSYKGNPVFYHNLMFYFYAMPFVLADDGIVYSETEPLEFEGKSYPGIKIGYEAGVGVSPDDEYFVYYEPDNFEMAWLAYTVTFFSKEKKAERHWIRYNDWKKFNGLLLPNSLTWYKYENNLPTEVRRTRQFSNVQVSDQPFPDSVFIAVEGAEIAE